MVGNRVAPRRAMRFGDRLFELDDRPDSLGCFGRTAYNDGIEGGSLKRPTFIAKSEDISMRADKIRLRDSA